MYPAPISQLIEEFAKLPSVGIKSAQRLAFYLLKQPEEYSINFSKVITDAKENIFRCSICQNFTDIEPCVICSDIKRNKNILCVVENPQDVIAIEKTKEFNGLYHVLHGVISPVANIGPSDITVMELIARTKSSGVEEIIMALNSSVEGDATAVYIANFLKSGSVKITRLAHGIPVGGDLVYADQITLSKALEGRREL